MPIWTDAYLADTGHLTTLEHGTYLLLLITMWRAGGSLPNDDRKLARFARLTAGQWRRIRPTIMEFFHVDGDRITQGRLTDELAFVRRRSARQSDNARAKSRKNLRHEVATAEPNESQTGAPTPTPTPISGGGGSAHAREGPVDPMIDKVVEAAQADVRREGWYDFNVAAALKRWRDLGLGDDEILTVVRTLTEKKRDGPAKGPAYFDEAMARAAGAKQQPGLEPINGGARHDGSRRTASEHRKIRETEADAHFVADLEGWGEGGGGTS